MRVSAINKERNGKTYINGTKPDKVNRKKIGAFHKNKSKAITQR